MRTVVVRGFFCEVFFLMGFMGMYMIRWGDQGWKENLKFITTFLVKDHSFGSVLLTNLFLIMTAL